MSCEFFTIQEGNIGDTQEKSSAAHAAAWALGWLSREDKWTAKPNETGKFIAFFSNPTSDIEAVGWATDILGNTRDPRAVEPLLKKMEDENENSRIRKKAIDVLGEIKDPRAVEPLLKRLADENAEVRKSALAALAKICEDETGRKLLSRELDGKWTWLDPQDPVDEERVKDAARRLELSEEEVRRRYERLAKKYQLKIKWNDE